MEDDARYPPKPYSFNRQKLPSYPHRASSRYEDNRFGMYNEQNDPDEYDIDYEDDDDEGDEDIDASSNVYRHNFEGSHDFRRYPKRQKLKNSVDNFQFKLDMLLGFSGIKEWNGGLACGVDSGEFVFMDTRVYLERANGFDEMRDSPVDSEGEMENEDGDVLSSKRCEDSSLRVLADSVEKFGEIYEKIESSKREHMLELEKMREDFRRELELQKKQILEKAQTEIAKNRDANDNDEDTDDDSAENLSD
ncbi:hypothetical protein HS088_TW04G00564 [Tripterygium wilfordii]|uniref:Uncharacterized protein n=1 Tax=Tripterygium wilfordii TaxID=458696 RepID=A0A7J7DR70_TRIWF|nr:hypothetical protein HS088_TW04G00564 [Tripterygium wilfordii]